jgi:hypothetical protein
MQRASFIETVAMEQASFTNLYIVPNVSYDWAGTVTGRTGSGSLSLNAGFSRVIRDFQARAPIQLSHVSCDNCTAKISVS